MNQDVENAIGGHEEVAAQNREARLKPEEVAMLLANPIKESWIKKLFLKRR